MQILTNREHLLPALMRCTGVVERRQTLPILGNFYLSAEQDGAVELIGTDMELQIRTRFPATVKVPGMVTLPARKITDICRTLPDGADIRIKVEGDKAVVSSGRGRYTLSTLPADGYPLMQQELGGICLELEQNQLRKLLEKTAFAMAQHDVRYYLNGLLFEVRSGGITAVATDGHRLAKVEIDCESDVTDMLQVILPGKTVSELKRLLTGNDDKVRLRISERTIQLQMEEAEVTSKLIDGRYPEYDRVIPRNPERLAVVDRTALRQALLRAAVLSNEKYKGVRVTFGAGVLRLQAHNPEQDEAEEELELDYSDESTTIGFNVSYVMDILGVLEKDEVEIAFSNGDSSALWSNKGVDNEVYVVMPMRI
jgi:DNA polymerase III subunit beta